MSFVELGSVLRAEREKRGLSLDSVAEHLKISARILRALEEGDESALPHTVYVRGFVRSYGNYLGLDSEELHEGMTALSDEEQEVQPANIYMTSEIDHGHSGGKLFLIVFILLCAAGAVFFWFYRDADLFSELQQARLSTAQPAPPLDAKSEASGQHGAAQKNGASTPRGTVPSVQSSQGGQPVQSGQPTPAQKTQTSSQAQPAAPAAAQPAASTPVVSSASSAASQNGVASAGQNTTDQANVAQGAASPSTRDVAPVSGHHKIIITALAECWIHSSADSTDTRQFSLRKGDTFALTFADKLVLKLGNAGGVRIRYNGEDLPQQGKEGQVKTLNFPLSAQ